VRSVAPAECFDAQVMGGYAPPRTIDRRRAVALIAA
jgi:hypothetical protein